MPDDFYELLDISANPSDEELKRAYRERAREFHPDRNDDRRASAQFKTIKAAYDTLRNPTERKQYDRLGHETYVTTRLDGLPGIDSPAGDRQMSVSQSARPVRPKPQPSHGSSNRYGRQPNRSRHSQSTGSSYWTYFATDSTPTYSAGTVWVLSVLGAAVCYGIGVIRYVQRSSSGFGNLLNAAISNEFGQFVMFLQRINAELLSPYEFAVNAFMEPGVDLLFPVGVVFLPLALALFAWKSDYHDPWIFTLASFGPFFAVILERGIVTGLITVPLSPSDVTGFILILVLISPIGAILGWGGLLLWLEYLNGSISDYLR